MPTVALVTEPFHAALLGAARARGRDHPRAVVLPADVEELGDDKVRTLAGGAIEAIRHAWRDGG